MYAHAAVFIIILAIILAIAENLFYISRQDLETRISDLHAAMEEAKADLLLSLKAFRALQTEDKSSYPCHYSLVD